MKLIIAYIQPFRLEDVRDAVKAAGVTGMSVVQIEGFGRQSGQSEMYRGTEYELSFVPRTRIDVLVEDSLAPAVAEAIQAAARTGAIGDGKIAIMPVDEVIRVRTGERGNAAL